MPLLLIVIAMTTVPVTFMPSGSFWQAGSSLWISSASATLGSRWISWAVEYARGIANSRGRTAIAKHASFAMGRTNAFYCNRLPSDFGLVTANPEGTRKWGYFPIGDYTSRTIGTSWSDHLQDSRSYFNFVSPISLCSPSARFTSIDGPLSFGPRSNTTMYRPAGR